MTPMTEFIEEVLLRHRERRLGAGELCALASVLVAAERERCAKRLEEYLVNKFNPPNVVVLWMRGERDVVQMLAHDLRSSDR